MQVGHWSKWLTDLFGMDVGYYDKDAVSENDDDRQNNDEASKSFPLLNALSDLLMLPKDMLMDKAIRKEVCIEHLVLLCKLWSDFRVEPISALRK